MPLLFPGASSPTKAALTDLTPKLAQQLSSYAGTHVDIIVIAHCPNHGGAVDLATTLNVPTAIKALEALLANLKGGGYITTIG